jgi:hypothetical protein
MASMTDQELRALVQQVMNQHLPAAHAALPPVVSPAVSDHVSHLMLVLSDRSDGPCVIEPSVGCTDCGYCKSLGH